MSRRVFRRIKGSRLNTAGRRGITRHRSETDGGPDSDTPFDSQLDQITRLIDALGRPETHKFRPVNTGIDRIPDALLTRAHGRSRKAHVGAPPGRLRCNTPAGYYATSCPVPEVIVLPLAVIR